MLHIKLDIVEKELQFAIDRAEKAEAELEQLKQCYRSSYNLQKPFESYANSSGIRTPWAAASDTTIETVQSTAPPPPPPPMPIFNLPPVILVQSGVSLSDGIAAFTLNNAQTLDSGSVGNQQVKTATGRYYSNVFSSSLHWLSLICAFFSPSPLIPFTHITRHRYVSLRFSLSAFGICLFVFSFPSL